jgi:mevalonate pyrophosphate decarboxylase
LINKKAELEAKLNSKNSEKELKKVNKEIDKLRQSELQKKNGFKDLAENKNLLYIENCYDSEF